ncbi:MAG: T9SS type A sorting domain-containing protein [Muribaculaceae bacterium]|nr:T9SS type A sorting domain-containing protein [Muribaculaceae bacterium]
MKKSLLLAGLCGMVSMSSLAFEAPKVDVDVSWHGMSPNGQYVVSSLYGSLLIYDRATGTEYRYAEDGMESYSVGIGNSVSNTGIVLCSNSAHFNASYWEDGQWKEVIVKNPELTNSLNAVTPDGSRIAGNLGGAEIGLDADAIMQLPAVWDRNADGSYTLTELPYPDKDFLGRVPQYVTATCISADGSVVLGQIRDFSGMFIQPIVYTQDAAGKWQYNLPLERYFTLEGEIPVDPGEGPSHPDVMQFMSEEGLAAYNAAMEAWVESGYDFSLYPDVNDYLTEAEKAAFDEAVTDYQKVYDEWYAKFEVFQAFFETLFDKVPRFTFNALCMSPDGKKFVMTDNVEDDSDSMSWFPTYINTPWLIDTANGNVEKLSFGKSMSVNQLFNDGTCFAYNGNSTPSVSYIIKDGECQDTYDYLCALDPNMKSWCEANLVHEVESYDWETEETTYDKYVFTGATFASEDMSLMSMWVLSDWDYNYFTWGYLFDLSEYAGISQVEASGNNIGFDAAGTLHVGDDIQSVNVYDLAGRLVLDGTDGSRLSNGIYLVRALRTDGSTISAKVRK